MSVLLRFLMMTIMVKNTASAENKTVSAFCGESVVLNSSLRVEELEHRWDDIRWLHHRLEHRQEVRLLSLKRNETTCDHGRCVLLPDGSLHFTRLQTEDSGNYTLEVFYKNGTARPKMDFELQVEERRLTDSQTTNSQTTDVQTTNSQTNSQQTDSQTDSMLVWICCLLLFLLLFIIIIIFIVRRRSQKKHITGLNEEEEEEVYVSMYGHHGNKKKDEKQKQEEEEEEESPYVPFNPAVSMETSITKQKPVEGDDVCV